MGLPVFYYTHFHSLKCGFSILLLSFLPLCLPFVLFQTKKSKKKAKQALKETKAVTADGKEPEEGEIISNAF